MWIKNNQNIRNGAVPGPLDDGYINDEAGRGVRLNHDFFIRPNLIHHIGVGYARRRSDFYPPTAATKNNDSFYKIPNITMGPGAAAVRTDCAGRRSSSGVFLRGSAGTHGSMSAEEPCMVRSAPRHCPRHSVISSWSDGPGMSSRLPCGR